jgi:hypothetical protein
MKGVTRVIRSKGTHRRPWEWNVPLMALGPTLKWPWRVFSVLMMGLLGLFLLAPGAAMAKTKASLNVVVIGDPFSFGYASSANATLRDSTPPTLAALNQIQAANPGVQLNVVFIPVKDASTAALNNPAGTGAVKGQSALIKSVSQASVVIVGLGAGNASLAAPMRSVLFSTSASQSAFSQLMAAFDSGSYLRAQSGLLGQVAADTAPGTAIITLGYPNVKTEQHGSSLELWSPYSWTMISQQQANMSDQLVSALNTSNQLATSIASVQHPKLRFVFANLTSAAQSAGSASAQHRSSKAKDRTTSSLSQSVSPSLIGGALLPVFDQAVNNELATMGVLGAQNVPPVTPKNPWNLAVLLPLASQPQPQAQSQPQQQGQSQGQAGQQQGQPHQWSNVGANEPQQSKPPASQPPAWLPPAPPSVLLPQNNGGSGSNGQSGQSGQSGQGSSQGSSHHHSGSQSGQPGSTGQPKPQPTPSTSQPAAPGQQSGLGTHQPSPSTNQPATSGQQAGTPANQSGQQATAPQPTSATQPAGNTTSTATPSSSNGTTAPAAPQHPGTPSSGNLPVLPTPPAPIPEPIAPAQTPVVGGGTPTNPINPTSPQAPGTPGTPTTTGTAPARPGTATPAAPGTTTAPGTPGTTTVGASTPSGPATTTSGPPTTSAPAATASGQAATSASGASAATATPAPATPAPATPAPATPATPAPATPAPATPAPATPAPATPAPATAAPSMSVTWSGATSATPAGQTSATTPGGSATPGTPTFW